MTSRELWRWTRFSRHLGEQVPDARYACAIEGYRPGRIRNALAFSLGVALFAVPWICAYWRT